MNRPQLDKRIFWGAIFVICLLVAPLALGPEQGLAILNGIRGFLTEKFGWLYMLFTVAIFGFLIWLATGKYAHVKFGEGEPEFSTPSWIAMMFTGGIGGGIMYWGAIEWAFYYTAPPFGLEPKTAEAAHWAATYGLFHWGFTAWAIFCLPVLPIAYAYHVRKQPTLSLSGACKGVIGKYASGWIGKIIDIFFIFGLIGGAGTSLGLEVPMISQGVSELLGIPRSVTLDAVIIVIWTGLFGLSAFLGLKKGIKLLADVNMYLALILGAFVFLFGATVFILTTFTNSVGLLLQNFIKMSFHMDFTNGWEFTQTWTIFYWAWWIAYAAFVGLFTARISRGRTIRGVISGMIIAGSLGCWIVFSIFGNTGLYFELNDIVPVTEILANQDAYTAIISIVQAMPLGNIVLVLFLMLMMVFLATTLDSSAFTLAFVATKEIKSEEDPPRWHRIFWAFILAVISLVLLYSGGLGALQTLSVITSFPLIFIFIIMVISFMKWLREDYPKGTTKDDSSIKRSEANNRDQ
ncbi:BCCT family transporter [Halobacillus hunanensis]|uniref:BCCT family transporter n=1 Tax=Halobacillus hunanensis TaxID=578214 RepID=UPI0009A8A24A|nr:BCCT family transporter [Halobacillus hunanensis]